MTDTPATQELLVLTAVEARVLGCLIEKKDTTPDLYPLTLNAVHAAATQKTSRDPVMALEVVECHRALAQLEKKGLVRQIAGTRTERYEHLVGHSFRLVQPQVALLGLMMLRGPQTAYELLARSERLAQLGSAEEVREHLDMLLSRKPALAVRLDRAPGQREERYAHLLCGPVVASAAREVQIVSPDQSTVDNLEARVQALEEQVAGLVARLEAIETR